MRFDYESKPSRVFLGAVISVLLGILFLRYPTGITTVVIIVFGWALGILGLTGIFTGLRSQTGMKRVVSCVIGVIEVLAGLLVALNPDVFIAGVFILIGLFVLLTGISDFTAAKTLSSENSSFAGPVLVIAVVTVVLGFLVFALPMVAANIAGYITGVVLLANGVSEAVRAFKM